MSGRGAADARGCVALFVALVGAGCGGEGGAGGLREVRDSAGVRIVESVEAEWQGAPAWSLGEAPTLEIGARDGDPALQFFRVTDALRAPDGRIVVLNAGTSTVRVFGPDGRPEVELGGRGSGPGEFTGLSSIHLSGPGELVAWDTAQRVLTWFSLDGSFLRSVPLELPATGQPLTRLEPLAENQLVVLTYASGPPSGADRVPGITRSPAPLLLVGLDPPRVDTLGVFPSTETMLMSVGGQVLVGAAPFPKNAHVAVWGGRIFLGTADTGEVDVYEPSGRRVASFRYPAGSLTVTDQDREWYLGLMAEMASTPQEAQMLPMLVGAIQFPPTRAAYSDMLVDARGALWLRTGRHFPPNGSSREWTVLSPDGALLGSLLMPEGFTPLEVGEAHVLGVWRDPLGTEFVRLYALERGG